ncbi:hypothetical protein D770_22960 [Flammeovirgaceae bacterium 311]|nr:hypothetical protein D770_22960 [Flammeovirgaceae bacterium 311]
MNYSKAKTPKLAFIVTALLMLQSIVALSQTNIQLDLYKPGTEIAKLKFSSADTKEPVLISVKNADGITLFSEKSKAEQYKKLISFTKLSEGTYFIDMEDSKGVVRKVLVKGENGLTIEKENYYFRNLITLKENDKKLLVKFNSNLNQPVTIRIMDNEGRILHEMSDITANSHTSLYNLSMLLHGTYNISLVSGDYVSSRTIQL